MKTVVQRVREMLNQNRDRQFVMALGGSELSDAGLARADLDWITHAPADTRKRMEAMGESLGVTPEDINRDRWQEMDMARACSQCGDVRTCRKYLKGEQVGKGPDTFCPNFQRFQQLLDAD